MNNKEQGMTPHIVAIRDIAPITHDTVRVTTEKPEGFSFRPGQATEVAINAEGYRTLKQPFSITSTPDDPYLEFIIKIYPEHDGMTKRLPDLQPGDELIIGSVFGSIAYKGEGVFIAGGSGVTPFVSILRDLSKRKLIAENRLIFANKTKRDVLLKEELGGILGDALINVLSAERVDGLAHGRIDEDFLKAHVNGSRKYYYLCGPPAMLESVESDLRRLGVEESQIVRELW